MRQWKRRLGVVIGAGAVAAVALASSGVTAGAPVEHAARFAWFDYRGSDGAPLPAGQYRNPILAGFYSDPSIVRVGADFYLVTSTFSWFPGIPVFHSRDLVHWRQIGNAIDRSGQLDFGTLAMSRGVFAPAISYHAGRFYIVNTCVDCGGNYVITATNPAGPWSDPVWLKSVEGIDPSLFFDCDGSAWLVNNREPAGTPRYDGHRAIWIEKFDPVGLRMLGHPKMIVDGGVDPASKPVWIEGPHFYHVDDHYYLMAAEGGTSVNHSEVVLRADTVEGAYVPAPAAINPILTQRDLPAERPQPISAAGHADLVQLRDGRWWSVFLATRPYAKDFYNTGRETFLLPVTWRDGWPVILAHETAIPRTGRAPLPSVQGAPPTTGSFTAHDDFGTSRLGPEWMTMRGATVRLAGGALLLAPTRDGLGDFGRPAFVARRQQHADAVVTTELRFTPAEGEMAGLAALQNDEYFLKIAITRNRVRDLVRVASRAGAKEPRDGVTIAEQPIRLAGAVRLRITAHGGRYDFALGDHGRWTSVARDVDGTNLSTEKAGGFVGTMIGPFAQGPR